MLIKQLQQQCPIIMESEDLFDRKRYAMIKQAQFFKNHQFIFQTLTEKETAVIKLRYGIDDGKILTCKQVSEILGFSDSRVLQLEQKAFEKMRKMNRLYLMQKYDDSNIDMDEFNFAMDTDYDSLIRKHIVNCAQSGKLQVINNIAIKDWDMKSSRGLDFSLTAKPKLEEKGINTCLDLINHLGKYENIYQFSMDLDISYSGCRTLIKYIIEFIDLGYVCFDSSEEYEKYLELTQLNIKKKRLKMASKEQRLIVKMQQDKINEAEKENKSYNVVNNPELCFIEDLNLTTRPYRVLKSYNINTVKDLIEAKSTIGQYLGEGSLKEVVVKLFKLGINLNLCVNIPLNDKIDISKPETVYIEDLKLSDRTYHALKRANINTLQHIQLNPLRIESIHGLGEGCRAELFEKLRKIGVTLNFKKAIEITR